MSGWTYPYSSGVLPTKGAIEIATGKKPSQVKSQWNFTSAERAFISIPGKVSSIVGREEARILPFVKDVFFRIKPGTVVSFPENNVTKCGNVISAAPEREAAVNSAESAARSILIRLETPNEDTENFLSSKEAFPPDIYPPDAFHLNEPLLSVLKTVLTTMPESFCSCLTDDISIFPLKELLESDLKDYMGRNVKESLEAIRVLTGLSLPVLTAENLQPKANCPFLGRSFWLTLIRGGYQGAVYYIDSLRTKNE